MPAKYTTKESVKNSPFRDGVKPNIKNAELGKRPGVFSRYDELDYSELSKLNQEGKSIHQLLDLLHERYPGEPKPSWRGLATNLRNKGFEVKERSFSYKNVDYKEVQRMHDEGLSIAKIAKSLGCDRKRLAKYAKNAGVTLRTQRQSQSARSKRTLEYLVKKYPREPIQSMITEGFSIAKVVREMKLDRRSIEALIDHYGIDVSHLRR